MGLFSKKKTYVAATTASLIEDTPDLVGASVSTSVIKGRDIAPDIVGNYLNGIYVNSNRYYSYGRDTYTYGLPNGSYETVQTQDYKVQHIIEDEVGFDITIVSNVVDVCNGDSFAYPWMVANRGYDEETGIVSNHPFSITEDLYFDIAEPAGIDLLEIRYEYTEQGDTKYVRETVSISGITPTERYQHVVYVRRNTTEPRMYWNYRISDGTHPELDIEEKDLASPYYPVVPVREHNKDLTADKETELYKTSKYLLNIIDLDIDEIAEGINENPDVGDVDHAYIIMGIDILSEKPQSIRYLHDYFDYLHDLNPYTKSRYDNYLANRGSGDDDTRPPPVEVIKIKDSNYNIEMAYSYITSEIKEGVIGKVHECTRENFLRASHSGNGYQSDNSSVVLRRQLTENTYSEVVVFGLLHTNYIYGSYAVVTNLSDANAKDSQGDRTNENFVVPLNYNVVRNMSLAKANELMYDAIKILFNSVETVKLKWYQTGFFKFVTIIVAIAITVITYQPGALTQSFLGAAAAGLGTLSLIMMDIVLSFAIKQAFEFVAEVIAPEIVYAVAIILAAYGVGNALNTGSNAGLPFANEALFVSNGLTEAVNKTSMEELSIEMEEFQVYAEAKQAELDDKVEELEVKSELDPMDVFTDFGDDYYFQMPSDYIYTSVHAGNIGVTTLDAPRTYVENTLSLPSLSNSLGVNINV